MTANIDQVTAPLAFAYGISATDTTVLFGDMDGDGIEDFCFAAPHSAFGAVSDNIFWGGFKSNGNQGIANYNAATEVPLSPFGKPSSGDVCMLGDFNGDGIADRLIHRPDPANFVQIDLSVAGTYGDGIPDYITVSNPFGIIPLGIAGDKVLVSDINGDGLDDLVLARDTSADPLTPGLQTLYGFFNDGTGFSTLNGMYPDIDDLWGVNDGVLFGKVPGPDLSNFKITQVTSAGPNADFVGTFNAPVLWNYRIDASLDLQAPWVEVGNYTNVAGSVPFTVTDAALDTAFPATDPRPKVFLRAVLLPAP